MVRFASEIKNVYLLGEIEKRSQSEKTADDAKYK